MARGFKILISSFLMAGVSFILIESCGLLQKKKTLQKRVKEATWQWQYPKPQGIRLYDVCSVDTSKFFAVGAYGTLLASNDNGVHWQLKTTNSFYNLNTLYFVDSKIGWAGGDDYLLKTKNGGNSWKKLDIALKDDLSDPKLDIADIYFTSRKEGWAVAYRKGGGSYLLYSDNGGKTWELVHHGVRSFNASVVDFISKDTGWVGGFSPFRKGAVLRTMDGGETWHKQKDTIKQRIYGIAFLNKNEGWAVGKEGRILHTTNGGKNWKEQESPNKEGFFNEIVLNGKKHLWVLGGSRILYSNNKGNDWSSLIDSRPGRLYGLAINQNNKGCAVGSYGKIYQGKDATTTNWHKSGGGQQVLNFNHIRFFNDSVGIAHGKRISSFYKIFYTKNAGKDWVQKAKLTKADFPALKKPFAWYKKDTLKTTNGKQVRNYIIKDPIITQVRFFKNGNGWGIGGNGDILATTDVGKTWNKQESNTFKNLQDVHFVDSNTGWIVGEYGKNDSDVILYTDNKGSNWKKQNPGISESLYGVHFTDSQNGYAVGGTRHQKGIILHTEDGGSNWQIQYENDQGQCLRSIKFVNANFGWAVGDRGIILYTTNGGKNWQEQGKTIKANLTDIWLSNVDRGWAVGRYGIIKYGDP